MRRVASAKRSAPPRVRRYSLRRPERRAASHPSRASRATEVRTRRSGRPKGAARRIKLPSVTAAPRGAMASPKIVTKSDPERSGCCARQRRNRARTAAGTGALGARFMGAANYDTENIPVVLILCHILTVRGSTAAHVYPGARYPRQGAPAGRGRLIRCARAALPGADRRRGKDRAQELDARRLSADSHPPYLATRPFGDCQ